ncbi:MAG: ankyrin repeat domain-containing protein [Acidobacteriota bacterium]|nr:ankyrin repeat domain-containing protein [Acidobacteriota bacterium]
MLEKIAAGRTDLVFEYLAAGNPAASLLRHCAYYGDVSAMKMLPAGGRVLKRPASCGTAGRAARPPLHRAAAFADEETIQMLLDRGRIARPGM